MQLLNSESLESEKRNQVLDDVTKSTLTSLDIKEEKIDLKPTIKGNTFLGYGFCYYAMERVLFYEICNHFLNYLCTRTSLFSSIWSF